ncbi:MAG: sel1 repeat family protein [Alphaproteobacteria bacterium]|nr:sel1 repeat family protein [Alphaproteobacteria bacterium]
MTSKFIFTILGTTFLTTAAMAGLPEAIRAYEAGQYVQALEEFTYLADEQDATALYYMGQMYENGQGVEKDTKKATEYYQRADVLGNQQASVVLAKTVFYDDTIENNKEIGLEYLKKVAYNGNTDALYELGEIYHEGKGVDKDYSYAFGYYLMAAMKGEKRSQHKLALAYIYGRGTPQDFENGVKWLARSANQGYVLAQKQLADFQSSDPRLLNLPDAYAWYSIIAAYNSDDIGSEAALRRDEIAKKVNKDGVLLSKQRAARNWRPILPEQSVSKEDLLSIPTPIIPGFNDAVTVQKRLAGGSVLYADGSKYGVTPTMIETAFQTKDTNQLASTIENAVKNGHVAAYAYLGDLFHTRFNDDKAAFTWYSKGAEQDDAYAKYQLANLYCEGRGVEAPSVVNCYKWLMSASKTEDETLKMAIEQAIREVESQALPEELEAGKVAAEKLTEEIKKQEPKHKKETGGFNFF